MANLETLLAPFSVNQAAYFQNTDPSLDVANLVTKRKLWVKTDTDTLASVASILGIYVRNEANDGWLPIFVAASYEPLDVELTSLAGLTSAADKVPYYTGSGTAALATFTAAARALVDDADAATMRATLGLIIGTDVAAIASPALTGNPTAPTQTAGNDSTRLATTAFVQAAIALVIGTAPGVLDTLGEISDAINDDANLYTTLVTALAGKQALHANLTALAGLTLAANKLAYATGAGALALTDFTAFGRSLVDDADAAAARTTLGLAALAVLATVGTAQIDNDAVTTAKVADAAITLAKLANLAQDQFIGRTTASTGVPQTATITAAARTLLDDTSVPAIVTTQFSGAEVSNAGNTSLGSGSPVIPTFDTEAYDTDAYHDTGTNPSRLTVPTGFGGKFDLFFSFQITNNVNPATGQLFVSINKNGATTIAAITRSWVFENVGAADAENWVDFITLPGVALADGDYVEVAILQTSGATQNLTGASTAPYSSVFKIRRIG